MPPAEYFSSEFAAVQFPALVLARTSNHAVDLVHAVCDTAALQGKLKKARAWHCKHNL